MFIVERNITLGGREKKKRYRQLEWGDSPVDSLLTFWCTGDI